ncbi:aldo/keto reductase [Allonocardiopsis opalescens]|uniref:Aryl-alcohol dehydrogenase-like predicted oxidoreductase n=1 Tax=Allonocardiopsis opalescens TaxID=1144618 RepID=A0A2T0PYY6_9ACTN|nr:aldo/keto reductase [Allonocardiopsis opalescens]PRX96754.1 aryl-alcohol dehydrogenase-like predicted oxidoreductase [Allonocardiopsis opalescens]
MRYRLLGGSGLRVSELFLGAMTFGDVDGSRRILDAYAEAGGNMVDTASAYGESEAVLGELLQGRRDRFVLGSKYTLSRDRGDVNAAGNHRKNLTLSLERSLRRLRTDYLDLFWVHLWDRHTPLEETMRALDDAVRSGKILYVGISDAPSWVVARANTLAEWRGWSPFVAVQAPYSLLQRDAERELIPVAEALGLTFAAWGPLAGGVLSGKFSRGGAVPADTRVAADSLGEREHTAARAVLEVADELGATASQVAIAWIRARSPAVAPIIGASTAEQLRDNLGAAELVLPGEAVERLNAAAAFEAGFPSDFIAQCEPDAWVFGEAATRVDGRAGRY